MKSVTELDEPVEVAELPKIEKEVSSDESSSDEEEEIVIKPAVKVPAFPKRTTFDSSMSYQKEEPKVLDQATLDDMKRQQSLQKLKDMHKNQKDAIKNALSNIDSTTPRNNKIVFEKPDPVIKATENAAKKSTLFDENEYDEEEMEVAPESFKIKKQFEGKKGERLFEIQTKFNNDSRFKMDEKFADDTDQFIDSRKKYAREELKERKRQRKEMANWDQDEMKEERDNQLSILESITGQPTSSNQQKPQQGMLRFDPSKKSHQKYLDVVKGDEQIEDDNEEMEVDDSETKAVEKDTEQRYYDVSDNLANAFKDSQPFSIFGMLGVKHEDIKDDKAEEVAETKEIKLAPKIHAFQMNQVRFKYDSSDTDEDAETEKSKKKAKKEPQKKQSKDGKYTKSGVWRYNFFVCDGDKRLQDAFAFLKKTAYVDPKIMLENRQKLKKVIKNQVRKARHDKEKSFKKRKV